MNHDVVAPLDTSEVWLVPGEFQRHAAHQSVLGQPCVPGAVEVRPSLRKRTRSASQMNSRFVHAAPRAVSTAGSVLASIFRSRDSDQESMYCRSSFIHVSKSAISLRPLTCQRHVRPGFMLKRRRCHASYCMTSDGIGGLGPTRLMSPLRTFHSWGSSSKLLPRRNPPIAVSLGSFRILNTGPDTSFAATNCAWRVSAFSHIDLNLYMTKGRPLAPLRVCRKNTGPLDVNFTAMAVSNIRGATDTIRRIEPRTSIARLISSCPCSSGVVVNVSIGIPRNSLEMALATCRFSISRETCVCTPNC